MADSVVKRKTTHKEQKNVKPKKKIEKPAPAPAPDQAAPVNADLEIPTAEEIFDKPQSAPSVPLPLAWQADSIACELADKEILEKIIAEYRELAGTMPPAGTARLTRVLLGGKLTIDASHAERGKVLIVARNCNSTLHRDAISLDKAKDRLDFVRALNFDDQARREIHQALLALADELDALPAPAQASDVETPTEAVIFKALPDGRLIEQINGAQFAIYNPTGETGYATRVEVEGRIYAPITGDPCIADNDLHLPDRLTDYDQEQYLDQEIEQYLSKFCDAPARELKFAAKLIRLTYIQDQLNEVPYLHIVGPSGSGKTRTADVIAMVCHRPYLLVEGTAASAFRICEKFMATLCFDEFNPQVDSEDQQALIQILNAAFQRRRKVPRVEKGPEGQLVTRSYRPFGVKIFSGLKPTGSYAFQRRVIPIRLSVTKNTAIPYCDDGSIDQLSAPLREKLLLWRLRELSQSKDYQSLIRTTEEIFKSRDVLPGFVQIGVPLAILIESENLRDEFISTLEARTEDAREDTRETIDGQIVSFIHDQLFDVVEKDKKITVRWRIEEPAAGKPCEALRVDFIVRSLNEGLSEKKQYNKFSFSRCRLSPLGFKTRQLTDGDYRGERAITYDRLAFAEAFKNFSLPFPPNPPVTPVAPGLNKDSKEVPAPQVNFDPNSPVAPQAQFDQQFNPAPQVSQVDFRKTEEKDFEDRNITPPGWKPPF